jgi:excisionase family DNA binding protein
MLSVRQLAQQLGCSRETVQRAIADGLLKARKVHAKLWAIEVDQRDLLVFKARLEHLAEVRRFRSLLMRTLWQIGKLKPRRKRQVQTVVVERLRLKRPSLLAMGQGLGARTSPIVWRDDREGESHCPSCGIALKVR